MNIALWIITALLAAVFLTAGVAKLIVSKENKEKMAAAPGAAWINDFSPAVLKTIGALEILGVIGLILPAVLDIAPVLVPLAALGLATIMVGAVLLRIRRHETKLMMLNATYLAMAAIVGWGRFGPESFG